MTTKARWPIDGRTTSKRALMAGDVATTTRDDATDTGGGGGFTSDCDGCYVHSVAALAEIAGLNGFTVSSFLRDTATFADCRPGQGIEGVFTLDRAYMLAVWGVVARQAGVSLKTAAKIVPATVPIFGMLRSGHRSAAFSLDPARRGNPPLPGDATALVVDLLAVWDEFWPRCRDYLIRHSADPNVRAACALFDDRVRRIVEAAECGLSPAE